MFLKIICQMHKKILFIKNLHEAVIVWLTKPKPTTKNTIYLSRVR